MIPDAELEEIQRRADEATPGRWSTRIVVGGYLVEIPGHYVLDVLSYADANFMAHARQDIPRLVKQIRELQFRPDGSYK